VRLLLAELGEPIMSSTLLLPGATEPLTDPHEIKERLEHAVDLVIDGGPAGSSRAASWTCRARSRWWCGAQGRRQRLRMTAARPPAYIGPPRRQPGTPLEFIRHCPRECCPECADRRAAPRHYHGALKNWTELQYEYDCYFSSPTTTR